MTNLEIAISAGSALTAAVTIAYVVHVVHRAGRDRPHDPDRLKRFVEAAPVERLDKVLSNEPERKAPTFL